MRGLLWGVGLLVLGFGAAQGASIDPLRAAPMPAAPALATSAPTPVATATAGVAVTNAAGVSQITALVNVRLRTGPGLQYRVTGNLAQGEMATVLGKSRGGYWWQVVNPKGGQAVWVSANPALTAPVRTTTTTEGATADAPVLPIVQRLTVAATHISFSPDNSLLALAAVDNSILVYRTADWTLAWTATVTATASGLDFSPDGNVLIAAGEDGNVHAWDAGSGAAIYTLAYGGWAYGPSFDEAGFYMASGARTGLARVVKTASGERVGEYNNDLPVTSLALSPQGPWLATMTAGSWGPVVLSVSPSRWKGRNISSRRPAGTPGP